MLWAWAEATCALAVGLCSAAELYLTDLCDEPEAEGRCDALTGEALQLVSDLPAEAVQVVEPFQTRASLKLSQEAYDEYNTIVQCNEMVIEVDNEIEAIAKTIRDEYAKRFPELESLILNPLDYARVVLKLGNEIDMQVRWCGPGKALRRMRRRCSA